MEELIINFPDQLEEALAIGNNYKYINEFNNIHNIVISGLGGSGIGATIVDNYLKYKIDIPVSVNKTYFLPKYTNEHTLVIIMSYSGNTEESVESLKDAINKKAQIICITSGGEIARLAKEHKLDCYLIPNNKPPRACLGYSMIQILFALAHLNLIDNSFIKDVENSITTINDHIVTIKKEAKNIASLLTSHLPIIYVDNDFEGVAVRWKQQINENSKHICWHNVIPEMNHNELVGWTEKNDNIVIIILRNDTDYKRNKLRLDINRDVLRKYVHEIVEVESKGASYIEKAMYLTHIGDWVSLYLGNARNKDIVEVKVIEYLKGELAKV